MFRKSKRNAGAYTFRMMPDGAKVPLPVHDGDSVIREQIDAGRSKRAEPQDGPQRGSDRRLEGPLIRRRA